MVLRRRRFELVGSGGYLAAVNRREAVAPTGNPASLVWMRSRPGTRGIKRRRCGSIAARMGEGRSWQSAKRARLADL